MLQWVFTRSAKDTIRDISILQHHIYNRSYFSTVGMIQRQFITGRCVIRIEKNYKVKWRQDSQCTYKLNTEARSWNHCCSGGKKYYKFWVSVCSLIYPACSAHAQYFYLWTAPLYNFFAHCLIKGTIFKKKLFTKKCVLISSINFV